MHTHEWTRQNKIWFACYKNVVSAKIKYFKLTFFIILVH